MIKTMLARFTLVSMLLFVSQVSYGQTLIPKVVCLDKNGSFIGWMTKEECVKQKGITPSEISKPKEKASK